MKGTHTRSATASAHLPPRSAHPSYSAQSAGGHSAVQYRRTPYGGLAESCTCEHLTQRGGQLHTPRKRIQDALFLYSNWRKPSSAQAAQRDAVLPLPGKNTLRARRETALLEESATLSRVLVRCALCVVRAHTYLHLRLVCKHRSLHTFSASRVCAVLPSTPHGNETHTFCCERTIYLGKNDKALV